MSTKTKTKKKLMFILSGEEVASFFIPGQPIPSERVRQGRGKRFYLPKRSSAYRKHVIKHLPEWLLTLDQTVENPTLVMFFCRETKRKADVDNLIKAIQDALLGIVYTDDTEVKFVLGGKVSSGEDKCETGVQVTILSNAKVEVDNG